MKRLILVFAILLFVVELVAHPGYEFKQADRLDKSGAAGQYENRSNIF